ncbi:hypothetical protein CNBG_9155 [Cryptococcus deuterogattii R265]|uniref:uncharacterized protein n=1 Tax=Cryptococcus deuterogattii (strain R265) TaxID=294750 RepID=UPI001934ECAC|nr:hypothetical protein CNBG_9155 [Cryptococcus deuterogattii R265]
MPQLAVVEKGRIDVPPGTPHRRSVSPVTRTRSNALSDKTIPVVSPLPSKTSTRIPSTSVKGLHLDPCEAPYIITHLTIELKPEERDVRLCLLQGLSYMVGAYNTCGSVLGYFSPVLSF